MNELWVKQVRNITVNVHRLAGNQQAWSQPLWLVVVWYCLWYQSQCIFSAVLVRMYAGGRPYWRHPTKKDWTTPSCRRCKAPHSGAAASHPWAWPVRRSWTVRSCPHTSARNCRCWQSSGTCHAIPGTPQMAGHESLRGSFQTMSETAHPPHH